MERRTNKVTNRRTFLLVSTAVIGGLAGCSGNGDNEQEEPTSTDTNTGNQTNDDNGEEQHEEQVNAREPGEMPPAYRIDFRNTGNTQHSLFDYTAENEEGEPFDIEDPAVRELNLDELDEWYENNWENTKDPELEAFINNPVAQFPDQQDAAEQSLQAMQEANSYEEFREHFVGLFFTYISQNPDMTGPISSQADDYLPTLQEAVDRYNDNFDIHAWHFQTEGLSEGERHGLGQVYDKTNDEMWVFETVNQPRTARDAPQQEAVNGQKIHETPYLQPGTHTYEEGHWHPLRFKEIYENPEEAAPQEIGGFKNAKLRTEALIRRIADSTPDSSEWSGEAVASTEFLSELTSRLYDHKEYDFDQDIYQPSKLLNYASRKEGDYVVWLDEDTTAITQVESQEVIESIRDDTNGIYDDFGDVVEEYNTGEHGSWSEAAEAVN